MTDEPADPPPEFEHGTGFYAYRGIQLVRGEDARVFDEAGHAYWDLGASYGCANVGHAHPKVTEAIQQQAQRLTYVSGAFANDARGAFVEALLSRMPVGLDGVFLSNSGTEAIEAAFKIAMAVTGRSEVVALEGGFHGRTLGALAATHRASHREPFQGRLAPTTFVPVGDEKMLEKAVTDQTAAVVVEPVQGEGGVRPVPEGFLQTIREVCDSTGAMFVADEVQTGLHRTGPFLAAEHAGVVPDVVCLAKSLAAGLPLGATVYPRGAGSFPEGLHGSTFGGNPVACAAATAVLDVLDAEDLGARARSLGAHTLERLASLTDHDAVAEVRGRGLMLAVQLNGRATPVLRRLQNLGFIALPAGTDTIRLLPPLVTPRDALGEAVDALDRILGTLT